MAARRTKGPSVQSVELTLRILENLAAAGTAKGVTQLGKELKTTKTRIYRHLQTLAQAGYVVQESETEHYRAGVKLYFLGQSMADNFDVIAAGRNEAIALRDKWGHSVQISVTLDFKLVILFIARPLGPFDIGQRVGSTYPVHCTAGGKIYLAFENSDVEALLANGPLERYTKHTLTERDELLREIEKVRTQGWAGVPNESRLGVNAISAPIFNQDGRLEASIAILGSVEQIPAQPPKEMLESLLGTAERISRNSGWRPGLPRGGGNSSSLHRLTQIDLKRRKAR